MSHPLEYLDLDEILEWFSIKGIEIVSTLEKKKNCQRMSLLEESSSDEEEFNVKKRIIEKDKKNIKNLPQRYAKPDQKSSTTAINEFNLSKKEKSTIR